ncbi:hypothetical protein PoB_000038500 [Plakobranchus ocellatus]|uniref:Uncharacterized protein n=1 Tax=Plakobranchus ocellatus TaxID=259542 RepID=A0AAV3XRX4_9GAST|nr:hypothetical protein PoB_000038500 [Plakobranchus ocellatus]
MNTILESTLLNFLSRFSMIAFFMNVFISVKPLLCTPLSTHLILLALLAPSPDLLCTCTLLSTHITFLALQAPSPDHLCTLLSTHLILLALLAPSPDFLCNCTLLSTHITFLGLLAPSPDHLCTLLSTHLILLALLAPSPDLLSPVPYSLHISSLWLYLTLHLTSCAPAPTLYTYYLSGSTCPFT